MKLRKMIIYETGYLVDELIGDSDIPSVSQIERIIGDLLMSLDDPDQCQSGWIEGLNADPLLELSDIYTLIVTEFGSIVCLEDIRLVENNVLIFITKE